MQSRPIGIPETTSEGQVPEVTTADLAGFWIRLAAFIIDLAMIGAGSWIVSFTGGRVMGTADPFQFPPVLRSSFMGLVGIASLFYFPWLWKQAGQTLGKRFLGIRVIRTDVRPLNWGQILMRLLGYLICFAGLGIPFIWVGFDGRKQGLHDKMARTYVIMIPKKKVRVVEPNAHAAIGRV